MPKPIKKRIVKQAQTGEDEVLDFLGHLRETASSRQRQVVTAVAALVGIVIIAVVIYFYQAGTVRKAERLEAQGYQAYNGLYEYSGLTSQEKAQKALELFTQANETRKAPFALLYMSNSHYELGEYQAAADTANQIIREFPDEKAFVAVARMKKAAALLAVGEKEQALETLNEISAKEDSPLADAAMFESAGLLEGIGQAEDSAAKYEELIQKYPSSPYAVQAMQKLGITPDGPKDSEDSQSNTPSGALSPSDLGVK